MTPPRRGNGQLPQNCPGGIYAAPTNQPIRFIILYGRGRGIPRPYPQFPLSLAFLPVLLYYYPEIIWRCSLCRISASWRWIWTVPCLTMPKPFPRAMSLPSMPPCKRACWSCPQRGVPPPGCRSNFWTGRVWTTPSPATVPPSPSWQPAKNWSSSRLTPPWRCSCMTFCSPSAG